MYRLEHDAGLSHPKQDTVKVAAGLWETQSFYPEYMKEHPDAVVVGVDDYYSHSLDQLIMMCDYGGCGISGGRELRELLWRIRSEYALARMAHLLSERHKQSGAIVMGYAHGHDFKELAENMGTKSRFFVPIPWELSKNLPDF
jgi:hypothetical protein